MRRERGSLVVVPVEEINNRTNNMLHVSESNLSTCFAKLLLANPSDILAIIEREKMDLLRELANDEYCPKTCFIEEALQLLTVRENDILNKLKTSPKQKDKLSVEGQKDVRLMENDAAGGSGTNYHYFYQGKFGALSLLMIIPLKYWVII